MNIVLSIVLGLILLVVQTVCLPHFFACFRFFDMLMPLVIYLGISRPVAESFSLAVVSGLFMDALSGGPFGFYVITYIWLLIGVRGSMYFLDAGSYFLFPLILTVGMLCENFLFAIATSRAPSKLIIATALLALVVAPFFLLLFNSLFGKIGRIAARLAVDRQG